MKLVEGEGRTVAYVLREFMVHCVEKGLEPATIKSYRYYKDGFLIPAVGYLDVTELTFRHLEALYQDMLAKEYATSSIQKCHVTIGGALKYAEREGWITRNVARICELPKHIKPVLMIPSVEQVHKFLAVAAVADVDVHDYARTIAATGCRPGEVCALMHSDLDGTGTLTVQRALDVCEGHARIKTTKTGKTRRITLDPDTIALLGGRPAPYFFGGESPSRTDLMSKRFKRVAVRANEYQMRPRLLRHFHATQLLASGKLSVRQVADRLGHSTPVMTLSVYSQAIPALDAVAADVIGSVLGSTGVLV